MNLPALRVALLVLDVWIVAHEVAAKVKRAHIQHAWKKDPANRPTQREHERKYREAHRARVRLYPSRLRRRKTPLDPTPLHTWNRVNE